MFNFVKFYGVFNPWKHDEVEEKYPMNEKEFKFKFSDYRTLSY